MKKNPLSCIAVVATLVAVAPWASYAQDTTKSTGQKSPSNSQQKTPSKSRKVWTDDDLGSLHNQGGISVAAAQTPAVPAAADASGTATPASSKPAQAANSKLSGKPALSNPKNTDEADGMIAWEQRDIDSQQEYVDRLQSELDQAPADQKEHLQGQLAERQKILADTRREQQDLIAQRKTLQKKSAADTTVASAPQR